MLFCAEAKCVFHNEDIGIQQWFKLLILKILMKSKIKIQIISADKPNPYFSLGKRSEIYYSC